jgi:hypothetical protein
MTRDQVDNRRERTQLLARDTYIGKQLDTCNVETDSDYIGTLLSERSTIRRRLADLIQ